MREWTDDAVILRTGPFRESDVWVRLLCRTRGTVTAFAFGAARSRRRFCGCLDTPNLVRCRVSVSRDGRWRNLEEAVLLRGAPSLRGSWSRMGMAANCLRFVEAMGVSEDNAAEAYDLTDGLCRLLDGEEDAPPAAPILFRWRFAAAAGFAPDMRGCASCGGTAERMFLLVDEGRLACADCRASRMAAGAVPDRYAVELPGRALDVLRRVQAQSPEEWGRDGLSPAERRACIRAVNGFVEYHLNLVWDNGRFRRA